MKTTRTQNLVACTLLTVCAISALMAQTSAPPAKPSDSGAAKGYIAAPPGSETLNIALEPFTIQMFTNADFKGTEAKLSDASKTVPTGKANEMPKGLADAMSSVRWNLPPGQLVVFYEDAGLKGEQLVLWGSGQMAEISKWDFNDKASRWAWFDVGGGSASGDSSSSKLPPAGSAALDNAVPDNTIQMFKNDKFRNDMKQIDAVTSTKAGELQKTPGDLDDSLSSLRWNLPEGVVVMLYEDANGKKDRVAIWGKGQLSSLDQWDFNDKVSRWSWAYIGAPAKSQ